MRYIHFITARQLHLFYLTPSAVQVVLSIALTYHGYDTKSKYSKKLFDAIT